MHGCMGDDAGKAPVHPSMWTEALNRNSKPNPASSRCIQRDTIVSPQNTVSTDFRYNRKNICAKIYAMQSMQDLTEIARRVMSGPWTYQEIVAASGGAFGMPWLCKVATGRMPNASYVKVTALVFALDKLEEETNEHI